MGKRILAKYPDRIPVVCEKAPRSDLPDIDKKKFLVPGSMLVGEFKYIIHKHINQTDASSISSDQTIYLFVNGTSPKTGALMSEVYEQYKDEDGYLCFPLHKYVYRRNRELADRLCRH